MRTACLRRIPRNSRLRPGTQHRHRRLPRFSALEVPEAAAADEPINRRNAPSRSAPSAALPAPADDGSARTTTSDPAGRIANRDRMRCRNRRATRCRTTDPPTVRPTTNPTLGPTVGSASPAPAQARYTTTEPRAARRPRRTPVAKSSRRVSRAAAGSNAGYPVSKDQADNSMRPLRRRAARIARPARVRMRNRNPWVLARRRLFGWNVRLPLLTAVASRCCAARSSMVESQPSGLRVVGPSPAGAGGTAANVSPGNGNHSEPWARARENTHRWAGDGPSLGGRDPSRQNRRLASLSGRHAVTSLVLAYTGFLWQHPRLVSLRRPNWRPPGKLARRGPGERGDQLCTAVDNSVDALGS